MATMRSIILLSILLLNHFLVDLAFHVVRPPVFKQKRSFRLSADNDVGDKKGKPLARSNSKKGYQFGDITRSLAKKAAGRINNLTGKEKYEFGDLSNWLDRQAKSSVSELTGKDYQFGDLTAYVNSVAKEKVSNFTGRDEYAFGDVSKELLRRVWAGEVETKDLFLALRVLLTAGASLTPIASVLPVKWLFNLLNFGLAQDIGGRLLEVLAVSLDERMKEALTGNSKYELGDISKSKINDAIQDFTGTDRPYQFGDISRRIAALASESDTSKDPSKSSNQELQLNGDYAKELEDWDKKFQVDQDTKNRSKINSK